MKLCCNLSNEVSEYLKKILTYHYRKMFWTNATPYKCHFNVAYDHSHDQCDKKRKIKIRMNK